MQCQWDTNQLFGCISLPYLPPHHSMNYNIHCFQTPIPAPISCPFHIPYWMCSWAEAVSSCLVEWQADWHHLGGGEAAASISSWIQTPFFCLFCCCILITCACIWRCVFSGEIRSMCSLGGIGKGWRSIIAVSAEWWNMYTIMFACIWIN